jgi:uncharacterized membrane protein
MKKYILNLIIISLLVFPLLALATPVEVPNLDAAEMIDALENLADWLFTILLITAVIFLVIAAFTFVTASGDPEKIIKARKFVLYALIGVGIGVASYGIISLVVWTIDQNTNLPF